MPDSDAGTYATKVAVYFASDSLSCCVCSWRGSCRGKLLIHHWGHINASPPRGFYSCNQPFDEWASIIVTCERCFIAGDCFTRGSKSLLVWSVASQYGGLWGGRQLRRWTVSYAGDYDNTYETQNNLGHT